MTTFHITAARSGRHWHLRAPAIKGAYGKCRRLEQIDELMTDVLDRLDIDTDDLTFEVTTVLDPAIESQLEDIRGQRAQIARLQEALEGSLTSAARELSTDADLSNRDLGVVLGVTDRWVRTALRPEAPPEEVDLRDGITTEVRPPARLPPEIARRSLPLASR